MKSVLQFFYIVWQWFIALPVFALITLFTAITTMIFIHWRNSEWLHRIQQFWSRSFFYLLFVPVEITGTENIRPGQSYVFVSNHQSMSDVFLIYGWLPVIFKWIMKKELRKIPFVGTACAAAGHIFLERGRTKSVVGTVKQAERVLHDGVCVVIFPEGTRTADGQVGRFKRGAFGIAEDLNLPVIPITLNGCFELLPKGRFYAVHTPVSMYIGKEVNMADFPDQETAIATIRQAVIEG
ncbi:MAG: 1-acyl-sn-glycerol-3-phosphate acyltransferase [Paludibacteraceae bacterium]|nr:1-acyl-sn-glycerol-3-phosphate acyltransferase [Paludibacteraceae bacterium]